MVDHQGMDLPPPRTQAGFTLIELLATIAVLGVMAGVVVLGAGRMLESADAEVCRADARVLVTAAESGRVLQGTYQDEDELVTAGLLDAPSSLNDIVVDDDGYSIVGVDSCDGTDGGVTAIEAWSVMTRGDDFAFGSDGAVTVSGSGERQALAAAEPSTRARIEFLGALMTRGNGWGAVFHGAQDGRGRLEGFVFQIDPGYRGGRFVLRQRANGRETRPLMVTEPPAGFDFRAGHDVVLDVDGATMTARIDGVEVMRVDDLSAAARAAGSSQPARTDGVAGLRLWHTTDLVVSSVRSS